MMIDSNKPNTSAAKSSVTPLNSASCHRADAPCRAGARLATFIALWAIVNMVGEAAPRWPTFRKRTGIIACGDSRNARRGARDCDRACVVGSAQMSVRSRPDRLAGPVLQLRLPRIRYDLGDGIGQRHVVEVRGELLPIVERPIEELQHFSGILRLVLLHVHQDEARTGDRPR